MGYNPKYFNMRNSDSLKIELGADDIYGLLLSYIKETKILNKAYSMSEKHYRNMYKLFNYPLVVISTVTTILSGLNVNQYILLSLSATMMILLGFDKLISPKEKEHDANRYAVEYGEIASSIKQFIMSNNRTKTEIKAYSETIYALITKWRSYNPPVKDKFVKQATLDCTTKLRSHKMNLPKQWEAVEKKKLSTATNT